MAIREKHLMEMEVIKHQAIQQVDTPMWKPLVEKYELYAKQLKLYDELVK